MALDHHVSAGFMPLFDSAVLIAAKELGFAEREGVALTLHRETSWANIRDRIAIGHFDVAHMLGPMPIACNLGLTPLSSDTIVPFALGLGGNCVTVSNTVWAGMVAHGAKPDLDPAGAGAALRRFIEERTVAGLEPLRFAVTHPHSGHKYELSYWLAACGIDPLRGVDIVIVPPPFMADALGAGRIDGYCVGEPWNSASVARGTGHIATVKAAIWKNSPEKVLGVRKAWAEDYAAALSALLRAMHLSARWCQDAANRTELAKLMARPEFLGLPPEMQMPILSGELNVGGGVARQGRGFLPALRQGGELPLEEPRAVVLHADGALGPGRPFARERAIARDCYRPDLYRAP